MLLYITAQCITEVQRRPTRRLAIILLRLWDILAVIHKIIFQVLLCLKLQAVLQLHLYQVFIPFWALLFQMVISLAYRIYIHETAANLLTRPIY